MAIPEVPKKKSTGKTVARIIWLSLGIFAALLVLGYNIPNIARWGYEGSIQIMEGRLPRLEVPADRAAELRRYVAALKHFVKTTRLDTDKILMYTRASEPLERVLKNGRADDRDMLEIQQAFTDAQIPLENQATPAPAEPKK